MDYFLSAYQIIDDQLFINIFFLFENNQTVIINLKLHHTCIISFIHFIKFLTLHVAQHVQKLTHVFHYSKEQKVNKIYNHFIYGWGDWGGRYV